jgi:DHA2 family multidrug resistance protein
MDYWALALPFLAQGVAMPFFFIPTNQLALSSVLPEEVAAAAGLSNFLRTTAAAFATSLITTFWENTSNQNHAILAGRLNNPEATTATLTAQGMSPAQALDQIDQITQGQAVMLSTDHMFLITVVIFLVAAAAVWMSPKPVAPKAPPIVGGH